MEQLRIVQLDRADVLFGEQAEIVQKALGNGLLFDTRELALVSLADPAHRTNGVTADGAIDPCDNEVDEMVKKLAVLVIPCELNLFDEVQSVWMVAQQQGSVSLKMAFSAKAHAFLITQNEAASKVLGRANLGLTVATAECGKADTAGLEVIGHDHLFLSNIRRGSLPEISESG